MKRKIRRKERNMLLVALAILIILILFLLKGCSEKKNENEKDKIMPEIDKNTVTHSGIELPAQEKESESLETQIGKKKSLLTGVWIPEETVKKRPIAVMLNNIETAYPQSGISQASILYEALAEGGITRLMGIFEEITTERLGSVRSARHYYASIADEYDAIFVHFGRTKYAVSTIKELGLNNLDGLDAVGNVVYYRDKSIKAPHNAFASSEGIQKGILQKGYRTDYEGVESHFSFYQENTDLPKGLPAWKVTLEYSSYAHPYFLYDKEKKVYHRYQYGKQHVDKNNGTPLEFTNILIQFVKEYNKDKNGYQTMELDHTSGTGYYITNGKYQEIYWKKDAETVVTRYYEEKEYTKEIKLNPGKTYISVFPNNRTEYVTFSNSLE